MIFVKVWLKSFQPCFGTKALLLNLHSTSGNLQHLSHPQSYTEVEMPFSPKANLLTMLRRQCYACEFKIAKSKFSLQDVN